MENGKINNLPDMRELIENQKKKKGIDMFVILNFFQKNSGLLEKVFSSPKVAIGLLSGIVAMTLTGIATTLYFFFKLLSWLTTIF